MHIMSIFKKENEKNIDSLSLLCFYAKYITHF